MFLLVTLQDQYSNVAGEGLDGQVVVTVSGAGDMLIPLFENKMKSLSYSLTNGETVITVSACFCFLISDEPFLVCV